MWHDAMILTVKSLNTRFREPLRKAIRAALGWLASTFCGLGLTGAGGDLHINTVTVIDYLKPAWAKEVIHTWKCWGCCLASAPPVWVRLRALPSSNAYPAKHTRISQTHTCIQPAGILLQQKQRRMGCYLQVRDEGQSLARKRFTALPLALPWIRVFTAMIGSCMVKHLWWRVKPPETTRSS